MGWDSFPAGAQNVALPLLTGVALLARLARISISCTFTRRQTYAKDLSYSLLLLLTGVKSTELSAYSDQFSLPSIVDRSLCRSCFSNFFLERDPEKVELSYFI